MKKKYLILCFVLIFFTILVAKTVYEVTPEKCISCQICVSKCPVKAIEMIDNKAVIDIDKCIGCGLCEPVCPTKAISVMKEKVTKTVYKVNSENCIGCGICIKECPVQAIQLDDGKAIIDVEKCIGCGLCVPSCPTKAIEKFEIEISTTNDTTKTDSLKSEKNKNEE